jgi:hypothetical protein
MADSLLTSSITALRTKIINDIASASVKELVHLARSAKALGLTEDTSVESAINTRANALTSGATVEEIKDLAQAVKQVKNDVAGSTISSADDIIDGVNNKFLSTANLNTELQSLTTNIKPDADVTRNLGEALYKFNTVYAGKVTGLLAPLDANDAATKSYVDSNVSSFNPASVSQSIIPDTNETYDLGTSSLRFRDAYLSGNTIHLGNAQITSDTNGLVSLPAGSKVGTDPVPTQINDLTNVDTDVAPEALEIQVDSPDAGHGHAWIWTWLQSSLPYARTPITNSAQTVVPLYMQGSYQINNFAHTIHGSMTQAHTFKLKWIEGSGDDNLISWSTSQVVSDSHPDINSGTTQDVQRLTVNVPSTITPPTLTAPSVSYTVGHTTGAYVFSGTNVGNNIEIGPFYRGGTYTVNINATGHPFYFTTDNGTNYSSGTYFGEWTSGVTGSRTESGTITFTVPSNAPDTLFYQCGIHSAMRGTIRVRDLAVETNENGNYIIYGQHSQEGHEQKIELRPIPTLTSQMCLVYDANTSKFVPQDLATYVENTPAFKNKIKEVAGTATLVAPDGTSLVASVEIYSDATYLPAVGNTIGDIAFVEDTQKLYIYKNATDSWVETISQSDLTGLATESYVNSQVSSNTFSGNYNDLSNQPSIPSISGLATESYVNSQVSNASITQTVNMAQNGTLALTTGVTRWYAPDDLTISKIKARITTAGNDVLRVDIKKNDVSSKIINISAGSLEQTETSGFSMNEGDYLTIDITNVGSTPGENLNVQIFYTT